MSKDMELTLRLNADGTAMITTVKKADKALDGLGNSADVATGKLSKTRRGVESISRQLDRYNRLMRWAGGLTAAAFAASGLTKVADDAKLMNARLRQATGSQEAFNAAQAEAKRIAREARTDYAATVNLFSRLSSSADQFNIEQSKIAATTEAVTYGLKLYGATAVEVSSVQTQLSQALASGTLAGDEFKSMAEASPRLMKALADGLGVARGELKKMAADGELTTEKVINALAGQSEALKQEFAAMPITVGEAMGQVKNTVAQAIASFDEGSGISNAIAGAIMILADNLGNITRAFAVATVSAGAFYAAQKVSVITGAVSQMLALERALGATNTVSALASIAMKRFGAGTAVATGGMRALTAAIMANPIGLIVTAIAGAITAFILFKDQIHPVAGSIASLGDYAHVAFSYIGRGIKWLMSPITNLVKAWDIVSQAIIDLIEPAKSTWETIGKVLSQFLGFVKGVANKFIGFFVGSYKAIVAMWDNFPAALNGIIVKAVNWALEGINDFVRGSANLLNKIPGFEIDVSTLGFTKLENKAKGAADSVYAAFSAGFNADYIGAAASVIGDTFTATVDIVKAKVHEIGDAWTAEAEAYHRLNAETAKASDSSKEIAAALSNLPAKTDAVGNSAGKAGKKLKAMGDDAKKAAKETSQASKMLEKAKQAMNDAADGLFAQLFPGRKLLLDMKKDAQTLANVMGGNATEAMEKYGLSVDDVAKKSAELNKIIKQFTSGEITKEAAKKAFDDMKKGIESVKEASKDAGNVMQEQFKRAVESIDQSFADMWKSLLDGGKISFKNLADNFKNIMAEVLHGVTTKPLTNAIMDSITGEVTESKDGKGNKTALGIWNTLENGFAKLDKTFAKGLHELLGMEQQTANTFGRILSGGVVGAGIGGGIAGLVGGDAGIGSIGGAIGGALGRWAGGWVSSAVSGALGTALGFAVPVLGSVIGSLIGGIFSRKKDQISRTVIDSQSNTTRSQTNEIKASVTEDIAKQFWQSATGQADKYGIKFSEDLAAMVTYKTHRKGEGPMMWYFDLIKDANKDGEGEQTLFNASFQADDDPKKIAQALAQMQVAALASADWSGVSDIISAGIGLVDAESMSIEQIASLNQWLDQTLLIEDAYGDLLTSFTSSISDFSGSFAEFQTYATSVYEIVTRNGKEMVDDLASYLNENAGADWAATAASLNVITQGMDWLGQSTAATNQQLITASLGITRAMGGAEAAMQTYQSIFTATATETHKAGIAYQTARQQLDLLNASMSLSGDAMITTTDQLRAYVATLDPLSENYAEQIRWAGQMAGTLTATANASKYFDDAIAGINSTINGVINSIKEDMMSEQELYAFRKSQAEQLAASIAQMTDVSEIRAAADEASKLVSNMWRSLTSEQQTTGVGDWMIQFLEEMDTLAKGKIEAIQNEYGADIELQDNFTQIETAANNMIDVAQQQQQAGDKMIQAADNMRSVTDLIQRAAATMQSAAEQFNRPVDVDVTVQQVAVGGEIN